MKLPRAAQAFIVCLLAAVSGAAQQIDSGAGSAASALQSNAPTVPRLLKFSGLLTDATGKPLMGPVDVTFSIYSNQHDAAPLWQETQTVEADATGQYTVLLGAMSAQGVPMELFTSGEARWLGVSAGKLPEQPRVLLVSVPYALKAGDAETLGGKPASAYLLAPQDQTSSSTTTAATTGTSSTGSSATGKQVTLTTATGITPNAIVGNTNYIPVFTDDAGSMGNSLLYQTGGNVGIGTTAPVETLDVNGVVSSKVGKFFFKRDMTDQAGRRNWGYVTEVSRVGDFQILESTSNTSDPSVPRLAISSDGKVGIGIAAPNYDLDLNGSFATHGGRFFFRRDLTDSPSRRNWGFLTEVVNVGDFEILESTGNNTEPTIPRVAFLSGGNVGIGTTTPTAMLEVNGTTKFDGAVTFASTETITGNVSTSNQLVSTVATGTAPLAVSSTTLVPNLNADTVDGLHASAFQPVGAYATLGANNFTATQTISGDLSLTGALNGWFIIPSKTTSCTVFGSLSTCKSANVTGGFTGLTGGGSGSPGLVGGKSLTSAVVGGNTIASGVVGGTISGGGGVVTTTSGTVDYHNAVSNTWGTVGGGASNSAGDGTDGTSPKCCQTVGGGYGNWASGDIATIAGGGANVAGGNDSTIAGGAQNTASGPYATVAGGYGNTASGDYSFAAGCGANAAHAMAFVWDGANQTQGSCQTITSSAAGQFIALAPGGFAFYPAISNGAPANPVTIAPTTGNVGIGTPSPIATLQINKNNAHNADMLLIGDNTKGLALFDTGTGVDIQSNGAPLYINFWGNQYTVLNAYNSSSGYVGIGTASPDNMLTVNGNADKPGGGSWGTFSDARLKTVRGDFRAGLAEVLKLNPVYYRYKEQNDLGITDRDQHVGFVAQEVEKIIPEAVSQDRQGYLLVNNDPILWAMLNAIKQQQAEIKELKAQLKALKTELHSGAEMARR